MKVPFLKGGLEFCLILLQEVWTEDAKANLKEEKKKRKRKRKKKEKRKEEKRKVVGDA